MKYIVLIADGMEDLPHDDLLGATPLEIAKTPNMDKLAKEGRVGKAHTVPEGFEPASDVANLSIIGYDPNLYYHGRAPFEAANMGIELGDDEIAFRCNLVSVNADVMEDYSAGHISNDEADLLIKSINKQLGSDDIRFYTGITYRHLLILKTKTKNVTALPEALVKVQCTPPHNIMGERIKDYLPQGEGSDILIDLMIKSQTVLNEHEVNKVRIDLGENPANMIWLWGQGTKPKMESFYEKFNVKGAIISAVNLINGIGKIIGLEVINVPGATGYYDTNYQGKADYGMKSLENNDYVYIHVEAPDEAGHNGDLREKITAIENFDKYIVGTVIEKCKELGDHKILIMADHKTPVQLRKHLNDPVGFILSGTGIKADAIQTFSEKTSVESSFVFEKGSDLLNYIIKGENNE